MKVRAYAKVNLALDVVSRRADGYHELAMIMAPIALHDLILIERIDEGIVLTTNVPHIPTDERNIMYKAAKAMIDRYQLEGGVRMHCYKHIPTQAGLGGGSADGAAVIKAINKLFHLHISYQEMAELGMTIGADIPFCIYNKLAVVHGIGEQLEFITAPFSCHLLLVKPRYGVSTKRCFEALDLSTAEHPNIAGMELAIMQGDYQGFVSSLGNTLEAPSLEMVDDIRVIKEELMARGFDGALMSGSGSCVFGVTQDLAVINKAFPYFKNRYAFVRKTRILG